jgi:hypothetical protein
MISSALLTGELKRKREREVFFFQDEGERGDREE